MAEHYSTLAKADEPGALPVEGILLKSTTHKAHVVRDFSLRRA
jgi:hypothetical protein